MKISTTDEDSDDQRETKSVQCQESQKPGQDAFKPSTRVRQ